MDGGAAAHADEADAQSVRDAGGAVSRGHSGGEHMEGKGECGKASVSGDPDGVGERGAEGSGDEQGWIDAHEMPDTSF
jgi:hypothetical protein